MNVWDFGRLLVSAGILTQSQIDRTNRVTIIADTAQPESVRMQVEMFGEDGNLTALLRSLGGGDG